MECKILFASKTALANGIIDGKWIDLTDPKALKKIDAFKYAREGHEFFIGDSITSVPMNISENDDPHKLVDFVGRLQDLDDTQLAAYEAIVSELDWECEDALNTAENNNFDTIKWGDGSIEESIGRYYAKENGYLDNDYIICKYFDYERYGRDICDVNFVCDNGETIFVIFF